MIYATCSRTFLSADLCYNTVMKNCVYALSAVLALAVCPFDPAAYGLTLADVKSHKCERVL